MIRTYESLVNQLESNQQSTVGFNLAATYIVIAQHHPKAVDIEGRHHLHDEEEERLLSAQVAATARWVKATHGESMSAQDVLAIMEKEKGAVK